jgi:NAD(P)-dependent dehydrogenase (short-subunit alcohol dehydrogenase family)
MLDNKVILISGGTGQLGQPLCRKLLLYGASLSTNYRSEKKKRELEESLLPAERNRLFFFHLDQFTEKTIQQWISVTLEHYGELNGLVHTVGGIHPKVHLWEMDVSTWRQSFELNVDTAFLLAKLALPVFLKQQNGSMVFVSALAGLKGRAQLAAYSAAKGALLRLVESIAAETGMKGIRTNAVVPSILKTSANLSWASEKEQEKWVPPEDLAEVIAFLLSDRSAAIQGAVIPVLGKLVA